jgi:hypothetical protein
LLRSGDEPARFVEHVVGGQQHFVLPENDRPTLYDRGAVGCLLARVAGRAANISANQGGVQGCGRGSEPVQFLLRSLEKAVLFDEIARWVAGYGQLWKNYDIGAARYRLVCSGDHAFGVAPKVANCRVELCERNPHAEPPF